MSRKVEQLQIRVTPDEKRRLKRLASRASMDVSAYVLSRVLPSEQIRFEKVIRSLRDEGESRYALSELSNLLAELPAATFAKRVEDTELGGLDPILQNYVAAMVEHAAAIKNVEAPEWADHIEPLPAPYFATDLRSLRPHLLLKSPVAFRRRNIFVDSVVGDQV